jgi:DNA-binding CsgD family transcriptional regulator
MIETKLELPSEIYNSSLYTINGVKFSQREIDVIACVIQMRTGKKIASQLSISPKTIETHIRNITQKLECNSREGIVDFIEKSDKYLEIKRYYSYLFILTAFEEQVLSLSKKIATQVPRYYPVYEQKDANNALLPLIRKHLHLVGLKEVPVELICTADTANTNTINVVLTAQETDNYYLNFFNLLFKLFPDIDITLNVSAFEKQCDRLLDPHTPPNLKEDGGIDLGETTNRTNPKWGLISLIVTVGLLFVCAIAFLLMPPNADPVIRSSLSIPMDTALLTRAKLLREIDKKLSDQKGIQNIALIGIGGSGKTTLARQYAGSQKAQIVWELNAQNMESLKGSFESLAHALSKSEDDSKTLQDIQEIRDLKKKEEKIIAFVKEKFRTQSQWILIFDNVERFSDIQPFFPSDQVAWGKGKVILTTQDHHIKQNNQVKASLAIGELTNQEKKDLFAKIIGLEINHTHTKEKTKENRSFLENLPPFPLDVTVAAHYIKAT